MEMIWGLARVSEGLRGLEWRKTQGGEVVGFPWKRVWVWVWQRGYPQNLGS